VTPSVEYSSFLVRLWHEDPSPDQARDWQGEVENIQSGQKWTFAKASELLEFLHRQIDSLQDKDQR
jgi:hypothetical protein